MPCGTVEPSDVAIPQAYCAVLTYELLLSEKPVTPLPNSVVTRRAAGGGGGDGGSGGDGGGGMGLYNVTTVSDVAPPLLAVPHSAPLVSP
jgi:hypothetical protein